LEGQILQVKEPPKKEWKMKLKKERKKDKKTKRKEG
jgi:hypothetical protein